MFVADASEYMKSAANPMFIIVGSLIAAVSFFTMASGIP